MQNSDSQNLEFQGLAQYSDMQLIEELESRYEEMAFIGTKILNDGNDRSTWKYTGDNYDIVWNNVARLLNLVKKDAVKAGYWSKDDRGPSE